MGFVRNVVGGITGSTAAQAAGEAAGIQSQAAEKAIAEQRAAREQAAALAQPYVGLGTGQLGQLQGLAGAPISYEGLPTAQLQQLGVLPSVMPGDIGQDSLFQALKRQAITGIESSAAARGKLMSGTTPQAIAEQVQNLALQRAGQIQGMNLAARQQMIGERGQLFGQDLAARQALLGERIAEQERRYGQAFNVAQLGQAAAAGQAANVQAAAGNIGALLSQQANVLAAGEVGAANARGQLGQALLAAGVGFAGGQFNPRFQSMPATQPKTQSNYGATSWS